MGCLKLDILEQGFSSLKVVHNSLGVNGKSCAGAYLFGFQGQEKDDEIKNLSACPVLSQLFY